MKESSTYQAMWEEAWAGGYAQGFAKGANEHVGANLLQPASGRLPLFALGREPVHVALEHRDRRPGTGQPRMGEDLVKALHASERKEPHLALAHIAVEERQQLHRLLAGEPGGFLHRTAPALAQHQRRLSTTFRSGCPATKRRRLSSSVSRWRSA